MEWTLGCFEYFRNYMFFFVLFVFPKNPQRNKNYLVNVNFKATVPRSSTLYNDGQHENGSKKKTLQNVRRTSYNSKKTLNVGF